MPLIALGASPLRVVAVLTAAWGTSSDPRLPSLWLGDGWRAVAADGSVRERLQRSVVSNRKNRLQGPRGLVAAHAGRVARHTGYGEADHDGAVGEQAFDGLDRNVPLENVAVDDGGVARRRLVGNAEFDTTSPSLGVVLKIYGDAAVCQVPDPARAAPSTRIAPHVDPDAVEHGGRSVTGRSAGRRPIRPTCAGRQRQPGQRHESVDEQRTPGQLLNVYSNLPVGHDPECTSRVGMLTPTCRACRSVKAACRATLIPAASQTPDRDGWKSP